MAFSAEFPQFVYGGYIGEPGTVEGKLATYYASYATALTLSFADGIITLEQLGDNDNLGYIEIDGEVYYTLTKSKGFTYNATNGNIYEELISEYFTIRHLYSLAD